MVYTTQNNKRGFVKVGTQSFFDNVLFLVKILLMISTLLSSKAIDFDIRCLGYV